MDTNEQTNLDSYQIIKNKEENALENKSCKSFFSQLKNFCSSLQNQYQEIENQFKLPPGSNPRNYDKGLKAIKLEVSNIKKRAVDISEHVNKIQQFSYFVESTRELINAQKEDLKQMENFLMKYGYVPPEVVEVNYDITEDEKQSADEVENEPLKSPELSEIGRKIIEGKPLPVLLKPPPTVMEIPHNVSAEVVKTPVQKNHSKWYMTPTPGESSRSKVEKWIQSVEVEAASLTPLCKNIRNRLLFEEENSESLQHVIENEYHTPDEPVMSYKLKETTSITPEDPIISSSAYVIKSNQFQDTTPEEPNLSQAKKQVLQETPEEPILLSTSKQKGEKTNITCSAAFESVSPQLSDITLKVLNLRQMRPSKINEINTALGNYSELENLEPESPKLSDVTLKFLHKSKAL